MIRGSRKEDEAILEVLRLMEKEGLTPERACEQVGISKILVEDVIEEL